MTLLRYLRLQGLRPVAAGNIKGMVDHYRTPETQRGFAEKYDQDVRKVTSFADSTKLSMETTVLANATGFHVGRRGMYGPSCSYVRELAKLLPAEQMLETLGALPAELPLETRRQTVIAMLKGMGRALGATPETIVADATRKLAALSGMSGAISWARCTSNSVIKGWPPTG